MESLRDLIPKHNCKNCGKCCGPVIINVKEYKEIQQYVEENKPKYNKNPLDDITCKFRVDNKCSIYSVRPTVCRLYGVAQGLNCNNGNTYQINGERYISFMMESKGIINEKIKTDY